MKTNIHHILLTATAGMISSHCARSEPLLTAWQTSLSGQYARVVEQTGEAPVTTWPSAGLANRGGGQSRPVYADVQKIEYNNTRVYIHGAGLASHQMGPWHDPSGAIFGNWPSNQNTIRSFPRNPQVAVTKTTNGAGALGLWVNGVALFNLLDTFSYNTAMGRDEPRDRGDGIWNRNAVFAEAATFDASNAHQPESGEYHYHDNPLALRYQLGDNVSYDASTNVYTENATAAGHSPILAYAFDGYPIYGPYGYSSASDSNSGVRLMVSGFVKRDGTRGTVDLAVTGRTTLATWSANLQGRSMTLLANQYGPSVTGASPIGQYIEDFDFLGDLGGTQGGDFDLDVHNGRNCVTPEYPGGTYAYFVTLDADFEPAFPYVIGRQYYGVVAGGNVSEVSEYATSYITAGPDTARKLIVTRISPRKKSLTWNSVEGARYRITGVTARKTTPRIDRLRTNYKNQGLLTTYKALKRSKKDNAPYQRYRVSISSLADYDPVD